MNNRPAPIKLTETAASKVVELMSNCNEKDVIGIRIGVKKGGCSGFKYYIEYATQVEKFEEYIEIPGAKIMIEPKAIIFLLGSTMDYINKKVKSGFIFTNPNSKGECGCGESFNV